MHEAPAKMPSSDYADVRSRHLLVSGLRRRHQGTPAALRVLKCRVAARRQQRLHLWQWNLQTGMSPSLILPNERA